jgi:hypothetical protein
MAIPASRLSLDRDPVGPVAAPVPLRRVRATGPDTVRARLVLPQSSQDVRVRVRVGDRDWLLDEGGALSLGRAPENDVVLEGEEVSRLHAEVRRRGGLVHLSDRSSNGTYVASPGLALVRIHRESILIAGAETALHLGTQERAAIHVLLEERSADGRSWRPLGADLDASDPALASFQREGEYWTIAHAGRTVRLKDTKGLRFLRELLSAPGREVAALDLVRIVEGQPVGSHVATRSGGALPLLDSQARAQYRRRLADLHEELEEAESRSDLGQSERIREEIEALTQELSRAFGLGGRERPQGAEGERARVLVTVRVREALRKIADAAPELGAHLASSLRTGRSCTYSPADGNTIVWRC